MNAGEAVCSSFLAGELSFTTPEGPAQTPTPVPGSSSGPGTTDTSIIMTNPPTPSATSSSGGSGSETSTGFESLSITSGGTHTDTFDRTIVADSHGLNQPAIKYSHRCCGNPGAACCWSFGRGHGRRCVVVVDCCPAGELLSCQQNVKSKLENEADKAAPPYFVHPGPHVSKLMSMLDQDWKPPGKK